ncbi:tyrosine-type recombinase/integrase [Candidatus Uabimicrobium amorphum]|uniref:Recombinase n=1 Tax=Uabimicrobium amorphum TaxID=2596890 RepID=A0A5S9IS83_UABAM|nr:tyrosine-type recombinase/integrase [Candidatus Uabimicrobium amorphum]BBM86656.1 recombinase [Candidatus Uabimicrobium amorphum]
MKRAQVKPSPIRHRDGFRLHFSFQGKQHRRFFIKDEDIAYALQSKVNSLITYVKYGFKTVPQDVSVADFVFNTAVNQPYQQDTPKPKSGMKLLTLLSEYAGTMSLQAKSETTIKTEEVHIRHMERFLQATKNKRITVRELNVKFFLKYKQYRYDKGVRTDTVNKELTTFQLMMQYAVDNAYVKENIVKRVKKDPSQVPDFRFRTNSEILEALKTGKHTKREEKEIKRYRYLTPEEIKRLASIAEGTPTHLVILVFACTGMRRGELRKLQWKDIDFTRNLIWISSQKQSRKRKEVKRRVEMTEKLAEKLKEHYETSHKSKWVFSRKGKQLTNDQLYYPFQKLIQGTEFEGVGFHVFRHSLASNLAAEGIDQRIIDSILGHQTEEMRERYRHLYPQKQQQAISKLSYM